MHLSVFVSERSASFGKRLKIARDLASILDGPLLDLSIMKDADEVMGLATARQDLFEKFSAVCARSGVPVPSLERETVRAMIPRPDPEDDGLEEAGSLATEVQRQVGDVDRHGISQDVARDCLAVARTLELIPSFMKRWGSPRPTTIKAVLNDMLMKLMLEPIRPDHKEMVVVDATRMTPPHRALSVLVVDDEIGMIVDTLCVLVGWPNLTLDALRVGQDFGADRAEACAKLADGIIERKPDIVLMDQGMYPMSGSSVIREITGRAGRPSIVFVGNTGGQGDELAREGAIGNCRKGQDLSPLLQAFHEVPSLTDTDE